MVGLHPNVVFELAPALTAIHPVLVPPRNGGSGTAGARRPDGIDAPPRVRV
jgi:hypothetical protein